MNRIIRHRLITIVLLGVLTSALSVVALVRLLTTSTAQRVERAHEAVVEEVDHLAREPEDIAQPTPSGLIGMRGGVWKKDASPSGFAPEWVVAIRGAVSEAREKQTRVFHDSQLPDGGRLVVAAKPLDGKADHPPDDSVVYVVYVVRSLPSLKTWQRIVALLAGAMVLLVATALYSIVTVSRGAAGIRTSLDALATDLGAPVPRPRVHELDGIADGISELARRLAEARVKEEELAKELGQKERLAALGRVAAGVAHEVRNPLASIKLRLDLATAGAALPKAAAEAITHATSEMERLDRLVADLLVVAGRATGAKIDADLGALAEKRAVALAPWADERRVAIDVSGMGRASLDSDAIARAIDNLLRNAVEASPAGASVTLTVIAESERIVVQVDDRGTGVPADREVELFEPFFTTKPAGTGLGLAISRAIARAHGGDVVYSREDDVTRFTLSVAVAARRASKRAAA